MVAIGPVRLCLVKIYIYEKKIFDLKWYDTKSARQKIVTFHRVILQDMAFWMMPNIA